MILYYLLFFIACLIVLTIMGNILKNQEHYLNNFDDIMDLKCRAISNNQTTNYLGPWDQNNGFCSKYSCPKETCSFLEPDKTLSNKYNNIAFKWSTDISNQNIIIDQNNDRTCLSKNGSMHPIFNTTYDCVNIKQNDMKHNNEQVCYAYDNNEKKWLRTKYKKILKSSGVYTWLDISNSVPRETNMTDDDIYNCRKEPFSCSSSNYYCCKLPGSPNPCHSRPINIDDQLIEYVIDESDDTGLSCKTYDECGVISCINDGLNHIKDCWQFDAKTRKWENNIFVKKFHNNQCGYYDNNNFKFNYDLYYNGICTEMKPEYTSHSDCALENSPIDCGFLNENEAYYVKTYHSKLDYAGSNCIYQTETDNDILADGFYKDIDGDYPYPEHLPRNDLCPQLTPKSCINNDHFLKIYPEHQNVSPHCESCPEGTYRNENMLNAWHEMYACTPNVICPDINSCTPEICPTCLIQDEDNPDNVEIVYLEQIPNKDECVVNDDSHCKKNSDGENDHCEFQKDVRIGNKIFCDRCPDGYALDVNNDDISCKKIYNCHPLKTQKFTCLTKDKTQFETFFYDNKISGDQFTPCVWKQDGNETNQMNECRPNCEDGKYKLEYRGKYYCDVVQSSCIGNSCSSD